MLKCKDWFEAATISLAPVNNVCDWLNTSASPQCLINLGSYLLLCGVQNNWDYCWLNKKQKRGFFVGRGRIPLKVSFRHMSIKLIYLQTATSCKIPCPSSWTRITRGVTGRGSFRALYKHFRAKLSDWVHSAHVGIAHLSAQNWGMTTSWSLSLPHTSPRGNSTLAVCKGCSPGVL